MKKVGSTWRVVDENGIPSDENADSAAGQLSGEVENGGGEKSPVAKPEMTAKTSDGSAGSATSGDDSRFSAMSGGARWQVQDPIPRQYATDIQNLPPQYVMWVLSKAEPVSLSIAALQQLKARERAQAPPETLS